MAFELKEVVVQPRQPEQLEEFTLPSYSVRVSSRAKYVRLKVSVERGIEVIVPQGFDPAQIPEILQKKQKWLKSAEDRIAQHREFFVADSSTRLPEALFLQSMGEQWTIQYQGTLSSRVSIAFQSNSRLIVRGFIEDETACQLALKRWIMGRAQECLVSWLQKLSEIHGLSFEKAVVRGQKTCWASCSHRKTISLNYKLLFLPPHLVHYVLIHELSHTVHLNHSRQFWGFVGTLEPDYKAADQELKEAWRYVPPWIERL